MNDINFERKELAKNLKQVADLIEMEVERKSDPRAILGYAQNVAIIANALAQTASAQITTILSLEFDALDWDQILRETGGKNEDN